MGMEGASSSILSFSSAGHSNSLGIIKIFCRKEPQKELSPTLTPKRRPKGKFHYPTAGLFSESLKIKIKIFVSFRNCKK